MTCAAIFGLADKRIADEDGVLLLVLCVNKVSFSAALGVHALLGNRSTEEEEDSSRWFAFRGNFSSTVFMSPRRCWPSQCMFAEGFGPATPAFTLLLSPITKLVMGYCIKQPDPFSVFLLIACLFVDVIKITQDCQ